jgi:CHAT domain-containing protein
VLYKRTGQERFFDLALTAVQATFLNLTDLSLRWQKIRAAARKSRDKTLAAEVQSLLFGFEPEMMQLLEYIRTVQIDNQALTRKQIKEIHSRYKKAARRFNNRHKVQNDLFRSMPAAKEIITAQPPKLGEIRSILRPGEAAIYIARVDDDYLRFLVTRDKTRFVHTRDDQVRVSGLINRMIENLTPQASGGYADFDRKTSRELYDLTLAPLERDLKNIDKIIWIGPDALAGLSPEVFTDKKGRLLFDRFSVVLNSSLVDLVESRRSVDYSRGAILSVLGIGAPQATSKEIACLTNGDCPAKESGRRFRSAVTANNGALSLAPLPETVTELLSLRDALDPVDAKLLFGPDATVASVQKDSASKLDLLAFATHGVPGERLESVGLLEPALLLGNPDAGRSAFLSTSDIATMNLKGRPLIILSACDTARAGNGSIYFDSLSGFYQAFRLAGATGVVATQWEVASDAAQRLIPDFVKRVRQGALFDQALRNAKIKLRDSSPKELQHPGYWMPFAFLGDGSATF